MMIIRMRALASALVCCALVLCSGAALGQAALKSKKKNVVFVKAARIVTEPGKVTLNGVMRIENGRVAAVGQSVKIPEGSRLVDLGSAWVTPGMIDCVSRASAPNDLKEPRDAIDPDNKAFASIEPGHRDFHILRASGITSVVVLPSDDGVVSGIAGIVKTDAKATMVQKEGPIALSLTQRTYKSSRYPTSLMGALELLEQALSGPLAKKFAGRASMIRLEREGELRSYIRLRREKKLKSTIITNGILSRVLREMAEPEIVCLPALRLESPRRAQVLPKLCEKGKHKVAFYLDAPSRHPNELRYGAALAVRMGLSRNSGFASVTTVPAEAAGVSNRIGSLRVGCDADFLVLDKGDLMDLGAPIREVWIGGERAHKNKKMKEKCTR